MSRFTVADVHDTHHTVVLTDTEVPARVTVVPTRGALVTSFTVGERELLYLDRATLDDPTQNVRGGIPVLFPIAGRLTGDAYTHAGVRYALKQHGFARKMSWRDTGRMTDKNSASAWLVLDSDDATRAVFPWDFHAILRFTLNARRLSLWMRVENRSGSPMPFHLGFHPYFKVSDGDKASVTIPSTATLAFDNRTKSNVNFSGFELSAPEVDLHLLDHDGARTVMHTPDGRTLELRSDEVLRSTLVVWTLAGKDFVCIEPWSAPGDALNTGRGLRWINPCETLTAEWSISRVS